MFLEWILAYNRAPSETELWSILMQERVLWQSPSIIQLVVALPRIIRSHFCTWVNDLVNVNLLHVLARHTERI